MSDDVNQAAIRPHAPPALRGLNVHTIGAGPAQLDQELDLVKNAGSNSVRVNVEWSTLEANGKGSYDNGYLAGLDAFVEHAAQKGLKVRFFPLIHSRFGLESWARIYEPSAGEP